LEVLCVNGDNIKMGLNEIIWEVVGRIDVAQDRGTSGRLLWRR
jgi:hypothetical protein